jgi:hypothetical protein
MSEEAKAKALPFGPHAVAASICLGLAALAIPMIAMFAFEWLYAHGTPGWMEGGFVVSIIGFFSCLFAAVGVLFQRGVRAALIGLMVGLAVAFSFYLIVG